MTALTFTIPDFWIGVMVGAVAAFAILLTLAWHFNNKSS